MKPLTLLVSLEKYSDGLKMAELIRKFDDTSDIMLHEAKKGLGWSITAHICIPVAKTQELVKEIRETGAGLVQRDL
jgi:hypothetical protein